MRLIATLLDVSLKRSFMRPSSTVLHASFGVPQKSNDLLFAVFAWFTCPSLSEVMNFLEK